MLILFEQAAHDGTSSAADLLAPVDQPLRRPFEVSAVRGGHVLGHGREAAGGRAQVGRNALAAMQQLDGMRGDAGVQRLADQRVRHAIAMLVDLDVVVDVNLDGAELRDLIGDRRQRAQRRGVQCSEGAGAAARQLLEGAVIQRGQQRGNRAIYRVHRLEPLMAQSRHDPAFNDLDCNLDLGFLASQQLSVMRNVA